MDKEHSTLFQISEWFMRLSVANFTWFVLNIPIVLVALNMFYVDTSESRFVLSLLLVLLTPIVFFPATSALFAMARDWVLKKDQDSLIKVFFYHYTENYFKSLTGGALITGIWLILIIDLLYLKDINVIFLFSMIVLSGIIYVFTVLFFIVLVHFNEPLVMLIKNAFSLTIGSPRLLLVILISSCVILYISLGGWLILIPFFTGSLIAFISFSAFYRLYLNIFKS